MDIGSNTVASVIGLISNPELEIAIFSSNDSEGDREEAMVLILFTCKFESLSVYTKRDSLNFLI